MNGFASLDAETFQQFAELIYQEAGIHLAGHKQALVSARLGKRMRKLNINNYSEYYRYVQDDASRVELSQLLDAISTNVTHFYREPDHFDVLASVAKQWEKSGQVRFRLWCAAASTGEEPYTIALTLAESLSDLRDVKILATDISTSVLSIARKGEYEAKKLEKISRNLISRYFNPVRENGGGRMYELKDHIKNMITFTWLNLSAPPFPMRGPLDVIFCRNVMIYFDNAVRQRLLNEMHRLLKPGGYLIVGHAESLSGLTGGFRSVRPSVYVKQ
ncbi:MAG: protein-glutamate O-methyltransferase [Desulfobacteraceae bacterium]|nr:protein-glutamate O-methyltransferase [Desulfobacteraceae bacterium]MCF8094637.1 protein-glutamate O-methyltransferase [Desulfobacteraceae bacterium]